MEKTGRITIHFVQAVNSFTFQTIDVECDALLSDFSTSTANGSFLLPNAHLYDVQRLAMFSRRNRSNNRIFSLRMEEISCGGRHRALSLALGVILLSSKV